MGVGVYWFVASGVANAGGVVAAAVSTGCNMHYHMHHNTPPPRHHRSYVTQYETVWRRVELGGLGWEVRHAPEDPGMQLYASWKYPRWVFLDGTCHCRGCAHMCTPVQRDTISPQLGSCLRTSHLTCHSLPPPPPGLTSRPCGRGPASASPSR